MAEEVLVKENLTDEMIESGWRLIRILDSEEWPVRSAFWFFDEENNRWKLILASDLVQSSGRKGAYEKISAALQNGFPGLEMGDVYIKPTRDSLVRALSSAITVNLGNGMRVSRRMIEGQYVADAFVYRAA